MSFRPVRKASGNDSTPISNQPHAPHITSIDLSIGGLLQRGIPMQLPKLPGMKVLLFVGILLPCVLVSGPSTMSRPVQSRFEYRIAILGYPIDVAGRYDTKSPLKNYVASLPAPKVEWNRTNLEKLKALGFNTVQ